MSDAASANPVTCTASRVASLDVLRGVAVLGILLLNIESFAQISSRYLNPMALGELPWSEWLTWLLSHTLAEDKFISMLTMLFGAGIVLMSQRSQLDATAFEQRFNRRMGWLFLFGLVHALFFWPGDILAAYALCGLIAVRLRHRSARELVLLAVGLYAAAMLLWSALSAVMLFVLNAETLMMLAERYWTPNAFVVAREVASLTSEWFSHTGERMLNAISAQAWMFASDRLFRMLGMMCLGMALLKMGFLSGRWTLQQYRGTVWLGLFVGVPVILLGVWFNHAVAWDFRYSMFLGRIANHWASVLVALAWIALIIIVVKKGWARRVVGALESVGRMAMTNYLMQTLIASLIFYGFGLGLFGRFDRVELLGFVLLIWAIQISFSLVWRRYAGSGPFESLWRRLARG